jgi:hypothetical protein
MGIFRNWAKAAGKQYHESGSEAEYKGASGTDYDDNNPQYPGNTVAFFAGYGVNPARSNGEDLEPIPITPVRGQNWPGMQIQLRNGWETTCYGKKLAYDDYLRMLTDSSTKGRSYLIPRGSGIGQANRAGPAPANVQSMIDTSSGAQPNSPGGPGFVASGVDLGKRRNYG